MSSKLIMICASFLFLLNFSYAHAEDVVEIYDDLYATSLTLSTGSGALLVNQDCIITVTITNKGNKNIFSNTGLGIFAKNFPDFQVSKSTYKLPSVAEPVLPNKQMLYVFEGQFLTAGEKKLEFTIDSNDDLAEKNEDNNYVTKTVTVLPQGQNDLAINKITIEPLPAILGEQIKIDLALKNTGQNSITNGTGLTKDDLYFDVAFFNVESITPDDLPNLTTPLEPSDIFTYTILGRFYNYGQKILNFSINNKRSLPETDFTNNASSTNLTVYQTQAEADEFNILDLQAIILNASTTIISWHTDQPTTGTLKYSMNNLIVESATDGKETVAHEKILENLAAGLIYDYYVIAKKDSIEKISAHQTFSMPDMDTSLNMTDNTILINVINKTASFTWQTNLGTYGHLYYRVKGATAWQSAQNNSYALTHAFTINNLTIGDYEYYLENTDYKKIKISSPIKTFTLNEPTIATDNNSESNEPTDNNTGTPSGASLTATIINILNTTMYERLKGKILLKVEDRGRAYYIHPTEKKGYFLNTADDAFAIMREKGVGITNENLAKIPIGLRDLSGVDSDGDGLTDAMEDALGTNKNSKDSDNDGHDDKFELNNDYNPLLKNVKINYDYTLAKQNSGRIFLQVQNKGEAWYINPADNKRYFLGRPADAYDVMRFLSLGINNKDFATLQ